jgi:hypothetical protein
MKKWMPFGGSCTEVAQREARRTPAALHAAMRRAPGVSRAATQTLTALTISLVSLACGSGAPSATPVPPAVVIAGPTATPIATPSATSEAEDAGLRLVATLDRAEVEPGGTVTAHLVLVNDRSTPATFREPCGPGVMTVLLPSPMEPVGETWSGVEGQFKDYALRESQGTPMESSIRNPRPTTAAAAPCHAPADADQPLAAATLASGETYETDLVWTASFVRDLPSTSGSMPFSIAVQHDVQAVGNGIEQAKTLEVGGALTVLPGGDTPVSAGQALDAAISDKQVATWLAKHPRKTWVNVNLFLQPGAIGVKALPSVPYWDVEVFAEPRSWVMVTVDASKGEVLTRAVCNIPCNR